MSNRFGYPTQKPLIRKLLVDMAVKNGFTHPGRVQVDPVNYPWVVANMTTGAIFFSSVSEGPAVTTLEGMIELLSRPQKITLKFDDSKSAHLNKNGDVTITHFGTNLLIPTLFMEQIIGARKELMAETWNTETP